MQPCWWNLLLQVTWSMPTTSTSQGASSRRSGAETVRRAFLHTRGDGAPRRWKARRPCLACYKSLFRAACMSLEPFWLLLTCCCLCQVDGPLSIKCYLQAVDRCYTLLRQKLDRQPPASSCPRQPFSLASVAYCVMHVSHLLTRRAWAKSCACVGRLISIFFAVSF